MSKTSLRAKIALVFFGIFLCLVLLELGLRLGGFMLLSIQENRNRLALKAKGTFRILCLGESTTAGGKDSYPAQLEEVLNQRNLGIKFSVINKGCVGANTSSILSQLENNLNTYKPNMVITMMGINDEAGFIPWQDINSTAKNILCPSCLRSCKLVQLIWLHLKSKTKEIGIYKSNAKRLRNRLQTIRSPLGLNNITQSSSVKDGDLPAKDLALKQSPEEEDLNLDRGNKIVHREPQAEAMLRQAVELNPKNDAAYAELGWLYKVQGKHAQAEAILKQAVELNPKNGAAYTELGWLYKDQGKHAQAETMLKRAFELNPNSNTAYMQLEWCFMMNSKYAQAEEIAKKALEIRPDDYRRYGALAVLYSERGQLNSADVYFQKANELRLRCYSRITINNYHKLKEVLEARGIKLVCVEYPIRSIVPLKRMMQSEEGIIFVDNEKVFKDVLRKGSYEDYFGDMFAGDFGHCTLKGNRLLAENIANTIIREYFQK